MIRLLLFRESKNQNLEDIEVIDKKEQDNETINGNDLPYTGNTSVNSAGVLQHIQDYKLDKVDNFNINPFMDEL